MCESCGKRFTTYEKVETIPLSVIKKDQTREQYDRSKIQGGILRACYKRPIPVEKIESLMDSIEGDIFDTADKEISSTRIGEIVMEHLKDLDAVAYVRFASVYREFKDVSTFMDELKKFMEPYRKHENIKRRFGSEIRNAFWIILTNEQEIKQYPGPSLHLQPFRNLQC